MAVTANIHEAKTTLSRLIERALAGEGVIIAMAGKPLVHLTPVAPAKPRGGERGILGAMKGEFQLQPGWDSPELDKEIEEIFYTKFLQGEVSGVARGMRLLLDTNVLIRMLGDPRSAGHASQEGAR